MWAIVPIKRFVNAKSRLSSILSDGARQELCFVMAEDVLSVLSEQAYLDGVIVITAEPSMEKLIEKYHCQKIQDRNTNLSDAMNEAAEYISKEYNKAMIFVPADLPGISSTSLRTFIDGYTDGVRILSAHRDGGTNVMACSPANIIPFAFGADSHTAHIHAAQNKGVEVTSQTHPILGRDIDVPEDLEYFYECNIPSRTRLWLEENVFNKSLEISA